MAPTKCIKHLVSNLSNHQQLFGFKPKLTVHSPLEKGGHPELDTNELDPVGVQKYQSIIGSLKWAVSLAAVMTLSSFRSMSYKGHLDRAQRVCSYLYKIKHGMIRILTCQPDFSDLPDFHFDWEASVYGNVHQDIPEDILAPLGSIITLSHSVDTKLYHDMTLGCSVTGILHLVNQTPIECYSKEQATVETTTYGSEFVAARTCVEQVIDLHQTFVTLVFLFRQRFMCLEITRLW